MNKFYSAACTIANNFSKEVIGDVVHREDALRFAQINKWCSEHDVNLLMFEQEELDYIFEWAYDMAWYHEYVF